MSDLTQRDRRRRAHPWAAAVGVARVGRGCGGFSLPEAITVTVILAIIIVAVSTIYLAAVRAYRRGEPANSA